MSTPTNDDLLRQLQTLAQRQANLQAAIVTGEAAFDLAVKRFLELRKECEAIAAAVEQLTEIMGRAIEAQTILLRAERQRHENDAADWWKSGPVDDDQA